MASGYTIVPRTSGYCIYSVDADLKDNGGKVGEEEGDLPFSVCYQ